MVFIRKVVQYRGLPLHMTSFGHTLVGDNVRVKLIRTQSCQFTLVFLQTRQTLGLWALVLFSNFGLPQVWFVSGCYFFFVLCMVVSWRNRLALRSVLMCMLKTVVILTDWIQNPEWSGRYFTVDFAENKFCVWLEFHKKTVLTCPADNNSALVRVIACRRTDDN